MRPKLLSDPRGELWIWHPPEPDCQYVVASDTAEGVKGGDFCALQVLETTTGAQCAEWETMVNPTKWGQLSVLTAAWYNQAWLVFETGCSAHGVSAAQAAVMLGYPRLYRRRQIDTALRKYTQKLGFATTVKTKGYVFDHARDAISDGFEVNSSRLLEQMGRTKFGEPPTHEIYTEGHDDLLIAYGIGCVVRVEVWNTGLAKPKKERPRARTVEDWVADKAHEEWEESLWDPNEKPPEEHPWDGKHSLPM